MDGRRRARATCQPNSRPDCATAVPDELAGWRCARPACRLCAQKPRVSHGSRWRCGMSPDIERLALLGWRLAPASSYSRAACIKDAATLATHDLDHIEMWARQFPGCNWRVAMQGSGIWALDVDRRSPDHAADGFAVLS